jgi:hypothetical protein
MTRQVAVRATPSPNPPEQQEPAVDRSNEHLHHTELDHPYFSVPSEPLVDHVGSRRGSDRVPMLDWRQVLGGGLVLIGVVMLTAGWWGISGTKNTYDQLSYFLSGGLGGAAAVIIGATILVTYEHYTDRRSISLVDDRLAQLENRLLVEMAALSNTVHDLQAPSQNGKVTLQPTGTRRRA